MTPPGGAAARDALAGVVLAAGLGTRLRPLTLARPKPLCPVADTTLLDLALDRLAPHVGATAVNAHWLADQVAAAVAGRAHLSYEEELLGSGGALRRLRAWLDGRDVLLTNADAYLPAGLDALVAGWDGSRPRVLVLDAGRPGGGQGPIGGADYAWATLLPWPAVRDLPDGYSQLVEEVWLPALRAGALDRVAYAGVAIDCGTPGDYLRANLHASGGTSVVRPGAVVEGRVERCVVWEDAYVGPGEHLVEVVRAGTRAEPVTVR